MTHIENVQHSAGAGATGNGSNPIQNDNPQVNSLVNFVIDAHGGRNRWRAFNKVTAKVVSGGYLWGMKGIELDDTPRRITSELRRQWTRVEPFGNSDWHLIYEPDRVVIEAQDGEIIAEQENPRETFAGHVWETPWTPLQLGYFNGYAMWTYYNLPFLLGESGFKASEIPSIKYDGLVLKGLRVRFPQNIHTHSTEQSLYFDESGMLRRQDYQVDIAGKFQATHLISDYIDVQGLKFPAKRRVHPRNEDGTIQFDKTAVSIDLFDFELG